MVGALAGIGVVALIALLLGAFVAVPALTRQTEDVARAVSAQVGERVVGDARQQRVLTGRRELAEANGRLIGRGLPIVPDPGPNASGDELLIQAARANVIADLPEEQVAGLRDTGTTLPSSLGRPGEGATARELGDRVVTLLPIVPGQGPVDEPDRTEGRSSSGGPSSSGSGGTDRGSAPTADRPSPGPPPSSGTTRPPAADRPGLLRPCVLGIVLC